MKARFGDYRSKFPIKGKHVWKRPSIGSRITATSAFLRYLRWGSLVCPFPTRRCSYLLGIRSIGAVCTPCQRFCLPSLEQPVVSPSAIHLVEDLGVSSFRIGIASRMRVQRLSNACKIGFGGLVDGLWFLAITFRACGI